MFYHIVMMRLGAAADAAFHREVEAFCGRFRREAEGVVSYNYGRNLADRAKGYDWAVIGQFASSAAHDAYQVSPLHQEMKAYMMPLIEDLVVCDFETP